MKINILFTILCYSITSSLFAQTDSPCQENSLRVRGIAILKQTPEILTANITLKVKADKFNDCQDKLIKALDQARKILTKKGIDKETIHTCDLNVNEKRDYLSENRIKLSFEGNSALTIEHPYTIEYARNLLSALQNDTINFLYNFRFTLSEDQKRVMRQKAIDSAIKDAKEKAEAIAIAAKVHLSKINTIIFTDNENGNLYESDLVQENVLFSSDMAMAKANQMPAIDFNPKEIGVNKSVIVEWIIEEKK